MTSREAVFQLSYRCGVNPLPSQALGVVLASAIAFIAWRVRSLSASGAIAAVAVGSAAMAAGWSWGALLVVYFVSSSALSHHRRREKDARTSGRVEKSGARDAWQVVANGGLFAACALAYGIEPRLTLQLTAAGALAASAADTWATELGVLSPSPPRSILTMQPVDAGVSGGVTGYGFIAATAAASLIGGTAMILGWPGLSALAALAGGLGGCVLDSVLGAAVQSRRHCPACNVATEQKRHGCGSPTNHVGGLAWLDNDGVNLLATVGGAALGAAAVVFA